MTDLPELPSHPAAARALAMVADHEPLPIANHSVRTYLHAVLAARRRGLAPGTDYADDLLFYACLLHDVGVADAYDGPSRFEVEGADAAAEFLTAEGFDAAAVDQVWEAIALHTSPHIAERRGPVTMLTRVGVLSDFGGPDADDAVRAAVERDHPRLDVERELTDAVVAQALRHPDKAPRSSWPGGLLRAHRRALADGSDPYRAF
jgi:hypothetical protein